MRNELIVLGAAAICLAMGVSPVQAEELLIFSYKPTAETSYAIYTQMPGVVDQRTPLLSIAGDAWCPRVSPDGTRVAFVEKSSGAIYVANIDGTAVTPLGNSTPASALDWSTDGIRLYFWGAADRRAPHGFYSVPVTGGATTPLWGGRTFWAWFYDGGFEVFAATDATGQSADHILVGASQSGQSGGKCDLLQVRVDAAAVTATVVFDGLGDIYTPSRNSLTGQILFQADHDRAGSHAVYVRESDGTTRVMSALYAGNPAWNYDTSRGTPSIDRFAYVRAPMSSYGAAAYQGTLYVAGTDGSLMALNTTGTAACPSFFNAR